MTPDTDLDEPLIRIVCAAIRHKSGLVIRGERHYDDGMREMIMTLTGSSGTAKTTGWYSCDQGFTTNKGEFLTREEAWRIAEAAGQIRSHPSQKPGVLHSEDLY